MKHCRRCGLDKPETAFGRNRHCLECESQRAAAYYLKHAEERKAYSRRYRAWCTEQRLARMANSGPAAGGV